MSQPLAKTPPAYNSSVLCPCDPIPLLVVLFSIAGTGQFLSTSQCLAKTSHLQLTCGNLPCWLSPLSRTSQSAFMACQHLTKHGDSALFRLGMHTSPTH